MRALSATLAAAIDSPSRVPALTVRVEDRPPLVDRCAWEDLAVSGPGLRRVSHCTGMDDGAVARAVVTTDGNTACCRDPLDGTPPSSWLVASAGATATGNAIGIATNGANGFVAWVATGNPNSVKWRPTTDRFLSYSAAVATVYTCPAGSLIRGVAAAYDPWGNPILAIAVSPFLADPDEYLLFAGYYGGSWSFSATSTDKYNLISAVAIVAHPSNGDTYILVTDYDVALGSQLCVAKYSAGWSTGAALMHAAPAAGMQFRFPSLVYSPIGTTDRWLVGWTEYFSFTPPEERPWLYWTTDPMLPGLPNPTPCTDYADWGQHLCQTADYTYLLGYDHGHRASRVEPAPIADLGPDLVEFALEQHEGKAGRLVLQLTDEGQAYATAGQAGALQALRPGSQVILGLGYVGTAGAEYAYDANWWIRKITRQQERAKGTARLIVECVDTLGWLAELRAPYSLAWDSLTVSDIAIRVLRLVAASVSQPFDWSLARAPEEYVLNPGTAYLDALLKLLTEAGCSVRFTTVQSGTGGPASVTAEVVDNLTIASPTALPVPLACADLAAQPGPNHVQVYAGTTHADALDSANIAVNGDVVRIVRTVPIADPDETADVAANLLALFTRDRRETTVLLPFHPGLEIGDPVTISDPWLGLAAAQRLVTTIRGKYNARTAVYQVTTTAVGPA